MDPVQIRALSGILIILGLFLIRKALRLVVRVRRRAEADERQAATDGSGDAAADGTTPVESGKAGDTGEFVFGDGQDGEDAPDSGDSGNERGG